MTQSVIDNIFNYSLAIDQLVLLWVQDMLRFSWLTPIVRVVTILGNVGAIWIALAILLLIWKPYRRSGFKVALALIIGYLITNLLLKNMVGRIRPYDAFPSFGITPIPDILGNLPGDASFPSGHTTSSVAAAYAACMNRKIPKKVRIPVIVLAILIPFSRMYLGLHYPSDIIGGIVVGVFAALLSDSIVRFISKRIRNHKKKKEAKAARDAQAQYIENVESMKGESEDGTGNNDASGTRGE